MPVGVDGTARFVQDVAEEAGSRTSEVVRARSVWEDLGVLRNRIRGKRIFFAGDTGLEIPLARFLADAGAVVLEVGAPRLDRRFLAAELQALGPDVDVVVSPDYRGQTNRIDERRPDVVISSPGLHLPLVARGHLCRSPRDFSRAGLYGYGGRPSHPGAPGAHHGARRDPRLTEPVRLLRGVYEGPQSYGILRVAASIGGVHALLRALPGEAYFPYALRGPERTGEMAPVTLSPMREGPDGLDGAGEPRPRPLRRRPASPEGGDRHPGPLGGVAALGRRASRSPLSPK